MPFSSARSVRTRSKTAPKADFNGMETSTTKQLATPSPGRSLVAETATKKRELVPGSTFKNPLVVDDSGDDEATSPAKKRKRNNPKKPAKEEKRLRVFRKTAPLSYLARLERATSQRMFVMDRTRSGSDDVPQEVIHLAGSTGNLYQISIGLVPSCTCPDHKKGNQCKHIIYVLHNVLKAPAHLEYQLAFLSSELREIFSDAPLPVSSQQAASSQDSNLANQTNNRKEISGDCPICFTEFEPESEEIVWCKAACGNNIHRTCFEQWARSQTSRQQVRCVFCRTLWQGDDVSIQKTGKLNDEGYVNVGRQLGLSRRRDYSTYHPFWVQQRGLDEDDYFEA